MVAGLSSRFGGKIKQFARIGPNGETLIEYSLKQATSAGFNKIIFIVGNKTEKEFKERFGFSFKGVPIFYAFQRFNESERDRPWGTADALCSAKDVIREGFVVCNGDDIYGENTFKILAEHLKKNTGENATIGYHLWDVLPEKGNVNRGMFKIENSHAKGIKETFSISRDNMNSMNLRREDLCSQNIFALYPCVVELLNNQLEEFKEKHKGDRKAECLLPEEISRLLAGEIKMKVYSTPDKWVGVTNPEDEEAVRKSLAK